MHDVDHSVRPVLGAEPGRHPSLAEAAPLVAPSLCAHLRLDVDHALHPVGRATLRAFPGGAEAADLWIRKGLITQAHGAKHAIKTEAAWSHRARSGGQIK